MRGYPLHIGIYAPYLHICGGGEKFIGKIAELLSREHRVEFIVTDEIDLHRVQKLLNLDLSRVGLNRVSPVAAIRSLTEVSHYVKKWVQVSSISKATQGYDLFLNQETLSSIPCRAKRGLLVCQIPPSTFNTVTSLANNLLRILFARLLFDYGLRTYQKVIVYSEFVARIVRGFYRKETAVLYPPTDTAQFVAAQKQNIILSVGRFFAGPHNKKQLELVRVFKSLYEVNSELRNWQYHLVGSVDPEAKAKAYAEQCRAEANDYPIIFHLNAPFDELRRLYGQAKIFWHGAGLNENENTHPERMEHFGITTVEAMAAGCVPVVINKGGQPEIVRNGINGLLWHTPAELGNHTLYLVHNPQVREQIQIGAQVRSRDFDVAHFDQALRQVLEL